jgi:pimeloyl-ACP methyl ester carboxylesterase
MGGLIAASLPERATQRLSGIMTLCAPLHFQNVLGALRPVLVHALRGGRLALPVGLPTPAAGWLLDAARHLLDQPQAPSVLSVWAPGSIERPLLRWALRHTFAVEGWRVLADLMELGASGGKRAGRIPVEERLRRLKVPFWVLAADADGLAPARNVHPLYELAGSSDKRYTVVGRDTVGSSVGHLDVLIGKHAPAGVWPYIADFAERYRRPPTAST